MAIIAILAGLLLPALGKARGRARTISCVNTLKTIAHGMHGYWDDNNDCMPPKKMGSENSSNYWMNLLTGFNKQVEASWKVYVAWTVFSCPEMKKIDRISTTLSKTHYGINNLLYNDTPVNGSFKISRIVTPSEKYMIADTWEITSASASGIDRENGYYRFGINGDRYSTSTGALAPRHLGTVNMLHADMHVVSIKGLPSDPHTGLLDFTIPSVKSAHFNGW